MDQTPTEGETLRSMSLVLDGPEIDALGRHHRREATRLTKAGKSEEAAQHASRADAMLQASIALTMERMEPPPVVQLDANGMDQQGRLWVPVDCGPGVRMVPVTSGNCLAVWQAYTFEADRQRKGQRIDDADRLLAVAGEFLRVAGELDPNLSVLVANPPNYAAFGFA